MSEAPLRTLLTRAAAVWLITLIILPLTAPLSACEPSDLFLGPAMRRSVSSSGSSRASLVRGTTVLALPTVPGIAREMRQATSERRTATRVLDDGLATLDFRPTSNLPETPRPSTKTILRI